MNIHNAILEALSYGCQRRRVTEVWGRGTGPGAGGRGTGTEVFLFRRWEGAGREENDFAKKA